MACVGLQPAPNADSEMEEGEIVDEVDYLSDISSEEEFLLIQRLKVLEDYNSALERKEAKRISIVPGKEQGNNEVLNGLSEVSSPDVEDSFLKTKFVITKDKKPHKQKRLRQGDKESGKNKEHRKKNRNKKKGEIFSDSEDSDFSDDDYKTKRRKLAEAVSLNIVKNDTTSLKDRLSMMLCISKEGNHKKKEVPLLVKRSKNELQTKKINNDLTKVTTPELNSKRANNLEKSCAGNDAQTVKIDDSPKETVDTRAVDRKVDISTENSDDDLELLRQDALKTKTVRSKSAKSKSVKIKIDHKLLNEKLKAIIDSDEEDSDTEELRKICLESRLLKKAMEIKQKQKLQKRLSHSAIKNNFNICEPEKNLHIDNNTDVEIVDMDIGSDGEDKGKELMTVCPLNDPRKNKNGNKLLRKEDELEEDEDLLRAKLLTSLTKNLPDLNVLNSAQVKETAQSIMIENKKSTRPPKAAVEEKKFIIELRESDSEGEHEATKSLTVMHIKLSEEAEFQKRLENFLRMTRLQVEKKSLQETQVPVQKPQEKFVAKSMNHLPKSEQIEYKNLVKRMTELEKMKKARQSLIDVKNTDNVGKDTLKPRNLSMASYNIASAKKAEEKIALSRKRIAEEAAKMLKLKEEATKLLQRQKIVATELKNIATAISFNKKQQKNIQNDLTMIRHQHQVLLKSLPDTHSNQSLTIERTVHKSLPTVKSQKENEPLSDDHKKCGNLACLKMIPNDHKKDFTKISPKPVQVETTNNSKQNMKPKSPYKDKAVELEEHSPSKYVNKESMKERAVSYNTKDKSSDSDQRSPKYSSVLQPDSDDYKSPLEALQCKSWKEDPNAVLCRFDFGGSCRDPDCKYLHPKIPIQD